MVWCLVKAQEQLYLLSVLYIFAYFHDDQLHVPLLLERYFNISELFTNRCLPVFAELKQMSFLILKHFVQFHYKSYSVPK
jgi:hypothetical protein